MKPKSRFHTHGSHHCGKGEGLKRWLERWAVASRQEMETTWLPPSPRPRHNGNSCQLHLDLPQITKSKEKVVLEINQGVDPHLKCPKHFKTPSYSFYLDVREQVGMEVCLNHGYFSLFKMDVQTDHTPLKGDNWYNWYLIYYVSINILIHHFKLVIIILIILLILIDQPYP